MSIQESLSNLATHFEHKLGESCTAIYRRPLMTLAVVTLITVVAGIVTKERLKISADLTELLPRTFASVQALDVLKERVGGIGYVGVAIRGAEPEQLKKLVDELAPKLEALEDVQYVDYKRPITFFRDRALYYTGIEDLKELRDYVVEREAYERERNDPLFVVPDNEERKAPPEKNIEEILSGYEEGHGADYLQTMLGEAYYIDPEEKLIVVLAKPKSISADLAFTRKLVDQVKGVVNSMDMTPYGGDITIEFGGNYTKKVDQQDLMGSDLERSTWVAILLVLCYVTFHFRRAAAIVLIMTPLVVGLIWTHGFAAYVFGILNILTASIGVILLGLGIDHGIHLLGRFESEWDNERSAEEVIRTSFGNTGKAVVMAGITTMVAFGGLSISEFRAFHEFGVIAAGGMLLMVIAYLTVLPALISIAIHLGWKPRGLAAQKPSAFTLATLRHGRPLTTISIILVILAFWGSRHAGFNADSRSLVASELPSFKMDFTIDRLLGHSQTPVMALTVSTDEEASVSQALKDMKSQQGEASSIDLVAASADLLPTDQEEKAVIIEDIRKVARKIRSSWVEKPQRKKLREFKRMTKAKPFTHDDLPAEVKRKFEDTQGEQTGFVMLFSSLDLSDGVNVDKFAQEVRSIRTQDGKPLRIAGEPMILADIFDMVIRESWPVIGFTMVLVLLTLFVLMGNIPSALLAIVPACFTVLAIFGLIPITPINLNYMNVCMLPAIFGISVDGGVHLVSRVREGVPVAEVMTETGRAIGGALLTTALGFIALTLANHRGLQMLGHLSVTGLAVNLVACMVLFPPILEQASKWMVKQRAA